MIRSVSRFALGLALCVLAVGCRRSPESLIPTAELSRKPLQIALTAWRDGQAEPGVIEGTTPLVQFKDATWVGEKQRLQAFEIVQEEPYAGGPRKFLVRLTLEGATAPKEVHYQITGDDPILICREEEADFNAGGM